MKAVILAGGSGERFWPLSTPDQPKQFLRLYDDISLLRGTYERLVSRLDPKDIYVITSRDHIKMTIDEIPEIPVENIIGESKRMNTAPACMVGSLLAGKDQIVLTVPADHLIPDVEEFWICVDIAAKGVEVHGGLFTFGIEPYRPDTGYGYIEMNESLQPGIYAVNTFHEKPDLETAEEFLSCGRFLWNSGMFIWSTDEMLDEMKKNCPAVYGPLEGIDPHDDKSMEEAYTRVERISIDNGLLERSDKVRVVPGKFRWSDVGTWFSIKELEGPSQMTDSLALTDSKNIYVRSTNRKKIAVVGLDDIVVIDTPEGLLICADRKTQLVKDASRSLNMKDQ